MIVPIIPVGMNLGFLVFLYFLMILEDYAPGIRITTRNTSKTHTLTVLKYQLSAALIEELFKEVSEQKMEHVLRSPYSMSTRDLRLLIEDQLNLTYPAISPKESTAIFTFSHSSHSPVFYILSVVDS